MTPPIHIVEPTLVDKTGHCYSQVLSLLEANREWRLPLEIWAGRSAGGLFGGYGDVVVHAHFRRALRRPQALLLYRRLLRRPGRIYLPTGTRRDLVLLDLAAPGRIPEATVFLLFHWLKLSVRKRRHLERLARRQPGLVTLAPSPAIVELLVSCGFREARAVPYPITPVAAAGGEAVAFRHILFGGAAREDKGFGAVVCLVEALARAGASLPVLVQTSPPHTGVHTPAIAAELARLDAAGYPHLERRGRTLDEAAYFEQYRGAVVLQLYDAREYAADRISGVTLDALSCGAPVVATAGTWMGQVVERFGAGLTLGDLGPDAVRRACEAVIAEFATFSARARQAGATLQREHHGGNILRLLAAPSAAVR
ncbi:MAG: hypothetical protein BWZ02_01662 [Lentisphaerae bacterium ADurb.BinA184]|nr:MAG: hypothetical protein BWZ02_01662 [Lentisphaerae bacterium ADurb.BinA184]